MSKERVPTEDVVPSGTSFTNASIDMVTDNDTETGTVNKFTFLKITAITTHYLWRFHNEAATFQGGDYVDGGYTPGNESKTRTNGGGQVYSKLNSGYSVTSS